jgi:N,N'-diacetyllegionaminate synthase
MGLPVIMSTGMCTLGDIEAAMEVLTKNGIDDNDISLLHCNTEYPTPFADVNLRAMETLKQCFGVRIGYSDHTKGIEVPIAAVAMGAEIIEKHFTLDRTLPGPDHVASLEPNELKAMVDAIRNIEMSLGSGLKKVSSSEQKNIAIARKSIVAACNIKAGEAFSNINITTKRPGNGINPMRWDEVIGKTAKRDFVEDELIEL